jgi:cytochrome c
MKKITTALMLAVAALMGENAEALFKAKCNSCHFLKIPADISTINAPMAGGVILHLKEAFKSKNDIKNHIVNFALSPSLEKAVCKSVKRFGLMPSMKGIVSKVELEKIAQWMIENLKMTEEEHEKIQEKLRKLRKTMKHKS